MGRVQPFDRLVGLEQVLKGQRVGPRAFHFRLVVELPSIKRRVILESQDSFSDEVQVLFPDRLLWDAHENPEAGLLSRIEVRSSLFIRGGINALKTVALNKVETCLGDLRKVDGVVNTVEADGEETRRT